jgi:hypothetical protein
MKMGHDRETYEHSLQLGNVLKSQDATIPGVDGKSAFLFRLRGLLGSKEKVIKIAGLGVEPRVVEGQSEMAWRSFVWLMRRQRERSRSIWRWRGWVIWARRKRDEYKEDGSELEDPGTFSLLTEARRLWR